MLKLPVSDYVENYYKEQGIELTFRQQARLCWTEPSLLKDQLRLLKELLSLSDDEKLNKEIQERITYEEESLNRFMSNDNPAVFYIFLPDDRESEHPEYFSKAEAAISYGKARGKKWGEKFSLEKRYLMDCCPKELTDGKALIETDASLGTYFFTPDGKIRYGWSRECEVPFDQENAERFENLYLNMKSPFGLGDIVMGPGWEYPQVVSTDHDWYEEQYERFKNHPYITLESTDNCIRTDYVHTDGRLCYDHTMPFRLWKIDSWEDEEYWKIILILSIMAKADVSAYDLEYLADEYARHQVEKQKSKKVAKRRKEKENEP